MKTFQKITLAAAISAAPFMSQAMEALDDTVLGNTTGQAGVTIEISIGNEGISVGEIEYTDTKTSLDNDGGSVLMENLTIKNITKLTQKIDVDGEGHLKLGITGGDALVNKQLAANGTLENATGANAGSAGNGIAGIEIALGAADGSKGAVLLQGTNGVQAELVNNLSVNMDLGDSTTTIYNLANVAAVTADPANNVLAADAGTLGAIGVVGDNAAKTSALAIGMNASFRINDLDVGMFGYTQGQATTQTNTLDSGVVGAKAAAISKANSIIAKYNAKTGGSVATVTSGTAMTDAQKAAITSAISTGSAVEIENLSFMGSDGGLVKVDQVIWADSSAVYMQIGEIKGDLNIAAINIGGSSIGSVAVRDINLAGMTQKIYGH
jgi:hypothetical protein